MLTTKTSKLALVLLSLAATACAPTPLQSTPTASASASAAGGASSNPASPTPSPTASAPAVVSPTPSSSAAVNQGGAVNPKLVVLSGTVYDEAGAPVDGASVTVNSLDSSISYKATTTTNQGSYVVNNLPEGVNVEIIATKANWTSRRRVGSFQAAATVRNEIDFGGPITDTTAPGAAYFISKYPEVAKTEPAYNASDVDPTSLTYKLTLSEPLDDTNRRRFEDAIRVLPANHLAAPTGVFKDFQDFEDKNNDYKPDDTTQWAYSIKKGSLFLAEPNTRATVSWDPTNTVATLTFPAPLITDKNDTAKYEVGLAAGTDPIVDPFNNQLGMDKSNSFTTPPPSGTLIRHAFVPANLSISGNPASGADRWAATHQSVSVFNVKLDNQAPKLVAVAYAKNLGPDSRFELTFDKPMAAYNGTTTGRLDSSLTTGTILDDLTLAVSDQTGGTSRDNLKGNSASVKVFNFNSAAPMLSSATDLWGADSSQVDTEFKLDKAAFTNTARTSLVAPGDRGKITVEVNPNNPKMVFLYIFNRGDIFDSRMAEIKARVEGVADPAGNAIKSADADNDQVSGSL